MRSVPDTDVIEYDLISCIRNFFRNTEDMERIFQISRCQTVVNNVLSVFFIPDLIFK